MKNQAPKTVISQTFIKFACSEPFALQYCLTSKKSKYESPGFYAQGHSLSCGEC